MLEGAAATTLTVSLLSSRVVPNVLVEPLNVCVAVQVFELAAENAVVCVVLSLNVTEGDEPEITVVIISYPKFL